MTPSTEPITASRPGVVSHVIQGSFPGGRPRILQASPLPAAPVQSPPPVQVRPLPVRAPILPGRPAMGVESSGTAPRPTRGADPAGRGAARHSSGCSIARPASAAADPPNEPAASRAPASGGECLCLARQLYAQTSRQRPASA